jgi:hypothetical protein
MLSDYFDFLKKVAINNPDVMKFRLIKEFIGVSRGFIRFVLELRDGTELHIFEYVDSGLHKIDYSYKTMIKSCYKDGIIHLIMGKLRLSRIIYIMVKISCLQKSLHS